jgi:hypothetical protein
VVWKFSFIFALLNHNLKFKIMGTRSLTHFVERYKEVSKDKRRKPIVKDTEIVVMYRQFDGYPSGHGIQLAEFLSQGRLVNGISSAEKKLVFNGMGCLTAQVVANFKEGAGGFYLHPAGTKDSWQDYDYYVIGDDETKELTLKCVSSRGKVVFEGTPKEFIEQLAEIEKVDS